MAQHVDERIVQMHFDNAQFEKGVSQTTQSLENLKNSLNFDNVKTAGKGIDKAAVDLSKLEKNTNAIAKRMSGIGIITSQVWQRIGNSLINFTEGVYKKTIGKIESGGKARAQNIENAKFQLKGLGVAWETVSDDIDYAVSGTAYGLDAAAKACGQLSASGVKAGEDMKAALRGISGVAAMANTSYEDISPIFTTVAGQGRLMTMQLRQLEARGINAAATLAKAFNKTEEELRDMVHKGEIDFKTFATAMDDAFGEHAKDANETFSGSLSNINAALSRLGAKFVTPAMEALIPLFNDIRETINKFSAAIDPLVEKFKKGFTILTQILSHYVKGIGDSVGGIEGFINLIGKAMDKIGQFGLNIFKGIEYFRGFISILKQAKSPAEAIKIALIFLKSGLEQLAHSVGKLLGSGFVKIGDIFGSWFEEIKKNFEGKNWWEIGFEAVGGLIQGMISGIGLLFNAGKDIANAALSGISEAGGWHSNWDRTIDAGEDYDGGLIEGMSNKKGEVKSTAEGIAQSALTPLQDLGGAVGDAVWTVGDLIGGLFGGSKIDSSKMQTNIKTASLSVSATAKTCADEITDSGKALQTAGNELQNTAINIENIITGIEITGLLAALMFTAYKVIDSITILLKSIYQMKAGFGAITASIAHLVDGVTGAIFRISKSVSKFLVMQGVSAIITSIGSSILKFAGAVFILATIPSDRIQKALDTVIAGIIALTAAITILTIVASKIKFSAGMLGFIGVLTSIGFALISLAISLTILNNIQWTEQGLITVGSVIFVFAGLLNYISHMDFKGQQAKFLSLIGISALLLSFANVIRALSDAEITGWEKIAVLGEIIGGLIALMAVIGALSSENKKSLTNFTTLIGVCLLLKTLAGVINSLSNYKASEDGLGAYLIVVGSVLLIMAMMKLYDALYHGDGTKWIYNILGVCALLFTLGKVIEALGSVTITQDAIIGYSAVMISILVLLGVISKLSKGDATKGKAIFTIGSLIGICLLLQTLSGVLKAMSTATFNQSAWEAYGLVIGSVMALLWELSALRLNGENKEKTIATIGVMISICGMLFTLKTVLESMSNLTMTADSWLGFGAVILSLMLILWQLNKMKLSNGENFVGTLRIILSVCALLGAVSMALNSLRGLDISIGGAAAFIIVVGSVFMITEMLNRQMDKLRGMKWGDVFKLGANILIITGMMQNISMALGSVSKYPVDRIVTAGIVIGTLLAEMTWLSNKLKPSDAKIGTLKSILPSIGIFGTMIALAVGAISGVVMLSKLTDARTVFAAGLTLSVLMLSMTKVMKSINNLQTSGISGQSLKVIGSMLLALAGISVIAGLAIGILVSVIQGADPALVISAGIALSALMFTMGTVTAALSNVNIDAGAFLKATAVLPLMIGFLGAASLAMALLLNMTGDLGGAAWASFVPAAIGLSLLIGALATVLIAATRFTGDTSNILKFALAMVGLGAAISLMAPSLAVFAGLDIASIIAAVLGLVIIVGSLSAIALIAGKMSGDISKGAVSMALVAIAVTAMIAPLGALSLLGMTDVGTLLGALLGLSVGLIALAGVFKIAGSMGPDIAKGAVVMALLAVSLLVFIPTLLVIGSLPIANMMVNTLALIVLLGALIGLGAAFGALAEAGGLIFIGAAAIAAIGGSVLLLLPTLMVLGNLDTNKIWTGVGALSSVLGILLGMGTAFGALGLAAGIIFIGAGAIAAVGGAVLTLLPTLTVLSDIGPNIDSSISSLENLLNMLKNVASAFAGWFGGEALTGAAGIMAVGLAISSLVPTLVLLSAIGNLKEISDTIYYLLENVQKGVIQLNWDASGSLTNLIGVFEFLLVYFVPTIAILSTLKINDISASFITLSAALASLASILPSLVGSGDTLAEVSEGLSKIKDELEKLHGDIDQSLQNKFELSGKMVALAIARGTLSLITFVFACGQKLGNALNEGYKAALGIASPSYEMIRDMDNVGAGIEEGGKNVEPIAEETGNKIGIAILNGVETPFHTEEEKNQLMDNGATIVRDINEGATKEAKNADFTDMANGVMDSISSSLDSVASGGLGGDFLNSTIQQLQTEFPDMDYTQLLNIERDVVITTNYVEDVPVEVQAQRAAYAKMARQYGYDPNKSDKTSKEFYDDLISSGEKAIKSSKTKKSIANNLGELSEMISKTANSSDIFGKVANKVSGEMYKAVGSQVEGEVRTLATSMGKKVIDNDVLLEYQKQQDKAYNMNAKAVDKQKMQLVSAYTSALSDLKNVKEEAEEIGDPLEALSSGGGGGGGGGSSKADESMKKLEELNDAIDGMGPDLMDMADAFYDKYGAMLVAIGDTAPYDTASKMLMAFGETLVDVGDLSEATEEEILEKSKEIMEALVDKYQGYKDVISAMFKDGNFFKEFEAKTELQADEVIKNMKDRLNATKTWAANLATLHANGISNELYEELIQMGVEGGYETVNAFMQMSAEELKNVDAMMTEAKNLEDSLAAQLLVGAADSAMKFTEGISNGIISNQTIALTAAGQMGANIVTQMKMEALLASTTETPDMIAQFTQMLQDGMLDSANLHKLLDTIDQMIEESTSHAKTDSGNKKNVEGVGKFMDEGIATGISSQAKEMPLEAMRKLVLELIAVAESTAQVESPSKWGIWFGHMIDYGIANGITEAQTAPIGAGQAMVNRLKNDLSGISAVISSELTPTITPYLDLSMLEQGASAINGFFGGGVGLRSNLGSYISAQQAQMAAMAANGRGGDSYNITINSPTTDARTLAREVEKAIIRR